MKKPAKVLADAAKKVRDVDCTPPDGRVIHPTLKNAKMKLSTGLREAGVPINVRKKVGRRFSDWARHGDSRFPKKALQALNDVPVDLPGTPVWDLPCLSRKQSQALMDRNIHTYKDVRSHDKWDLLSVPHMGRVTVQKLWDMSRANAHAA